MQIDDLLVTHAIPASRHVHVRRNNIPIWLSRRTRTLDVTSRTTLTLAIPLSAMPTPPLRNSLSVLDALVFLSPPSPILNPSQVSSITSGDIPILFDSHSIESLALSMGSSASHAVAQDALGGLGVVSSSCTSDTVKTAGTFGPIHAHTTLEDRNSRPNSRISWTGSEFKESETISSIASDQTLQVIPPTLIPDEGYYHSQNVRAGSVSQFTISAYYQDPSTSQGLISTSRGTALRLSQEYGTRCTDLPVSLSPPGLLLSDNDAGGDFGQVSHDFPLSPTFSSQATPIKFYPRPVSWDSTSDLFHPEKTARKPIPALRSPPKKPMTLRGESFRFQEMSSPQNPGYFDNPISPQYAFLPRDLAWLQHVVVELLIDQEGFREVRPSFKLVGYSTQTRSLDPLNHGTDGGVAEFMPIKRESFNFHYAPFDSVPILRRITVNGEESRDYISRQASLTLKSNGVYTVRGTEPSSLPSSYLDDASAKLNLGSSSKLRWKFDYMVANRKTGKVIDGEKSITPLTFSCSPVLLHSLQGKKVRLMHIVKKSVVSNLVAEKMEPPILRMPASLSPVKKTAANTSYGPLLAKSRPWHRRAQSNAPSPQEDQVGLVPRPAGRIVFGNRAPALNTTQSIGNGNGKNEGAALSFKQVRRRRASSAGEWMRMDPEGGHSMESEVQDAQPPSYDANHERFPLQPRHIVRQSQLSGLLSMESIVEATRPVRDTSGFIPLRPPPRSARRNS